MMAALRIVEAPSPSQDARPDGGIVDMLVLHYTGMKTGDEAIARLTDPRSKVSAHYTIDRDGRVFRHVPEERRAWHAGVSWWDGTRNVNGCSIGIELVNPGHEFGYVPFPQAQIAALIDLAEGVMQRHPIPPERVLGHSDVAPARKEDPGELFPWRQLAEFGIGVWPEGGLHEGRDEPFESAMRRFGYGLAPDTDVTLEKAILAFQRHFHPENLTGRPDFETGRRLVALLDARNRAMRKRA